MAAVTVEPFKARDYCYRCSKAGSMCICASVAVVPTRTRVLILQHHRERFHPIGTVRILKSALPNCRVVHCYEGLLPADFRLDREHSALLFPGPGSELLTAARPELENLIILDGTWSQAKKLFLSNPQLAELPRLRIEADQPSRYRIRKQPEISYQSSLEAVYYALSTLEPENGRLQELLTSFEKMIDRQLNFHTRAQQPRYARARRRFSSGLPPYLRLPASQVVVVYPEYLGPKTGASQATGKREGVLVQWVAWKPDSREVREWTFEEGFTTLPDFHLERIGLKPGAPLVTRESFLPEWISWSGEGRSLLAWEQRHLDFFFRWSGIAGTAPLGSLKSVYANRIGTSPGHLDHVVQKLLLELTDFKLQGRANARLACTAAMYTWLRETLAPEVRN
ncbi:MAG: hypothetical protein A2284_10170 [Deltaproteobacteria bacterium RIFOXYA12_FULL_61_11]|nr:MAG: hypothetical protein A2284_10170 [Deltaproteobacteria bacterium RIFOXYA12_FULL_61_11]